MINYTSQGKTHPKNITNQDILNGFHASKIIGGASGGLQQEFWELELLDDITRLRYEEKILQSITMANQRNTLTDLYCAHKDKNYVPSTLHKAIHWSAFDPFLEWK